MTEIDALLADLHLSYSYWQWVCLQSGLSVYGMPRPLDA